LGVLVSQLDYATIWRYFAFTNQLLAMIVLWTASMYLVKNDRKPWITVVPATFMSAVTMTYFFGGAECLNLPTTIAYPAGIALAVIFLAVFLFQSNKASKLPTHLKKGNKYAVDA
jgi:carbon starvation protein CstA